MLEAADQSQHTGPADHSDRIAIFIYGPHRDRNDRKRGAALM